MGQRTLLSLAFVVSFLLVGGCTATTDRSIRVNVSTQSADLHPPPIKEPAKRWHYEAVYRYVPAPHGPVREAETAHQLQSAPPPQVIERVVVVEKVKVVEKEKPGPKYGVVAPPIRKQFVPAEKQRSHWLSEELAKKVRLPPGLEPTDFGLAQADDCSGDPGGWIIWVDGLLEEKQARVIYLPNGFVAEIIFRD